MGSSGRPRAVARGGLQPLNGQLYQFIVAPRRLGLEATPTVGYCHLYKLGSIGSAYHRPRTWMGSAGRPCAVDIGGPQPLNGQLYNLIVDRVGGGFYSVNST